METNERFLYRGKRLDNGEWVDGLILMGDVGKTNKFICNITTSIKEATESPKINLEIESPAVVYETVSQCTGLRDKNGKLIFEGDIVRDSFRWVSVVEWDYEDARFLGYMIGRKEPTISYVGREPSQEVIGNKWDNPELLEVEE